MTLNARAYIHTREGRDFKSVIAYALVTPCLYKRYKDIVIDEGKEALD